MRCFYLLSCKPRARHIICEFLVLGHPMLRGTSLYIVLCIYVQFYMALINVHVLFVGTRIMVQKKKWNSEIKPMYLYKVYRYTIYMGFMFPKTYSPTWGQIVHTKQKQNIKIYICYNLNIKSFNSETFSLNVCNV